MNLRTILTLGAAAMVTGFLALGSGQVQAVTPHGPISGVDVNDVRATGTVPVNGIFKSGGATFGGFTVGCIGGTVGGEVDRGPNTAPQLRFGSLSVACDSWWGDDAVITLVNDAACRVVVTMADSIVHDTNAVDSGATAGGDPSDVDGSASIPVVAAPTGPCLRVSILGGCSFHVLGTMGVDFDEAIKTVSGVTYQDIVLKGTGLTTRSPSFGCLGLVTNGGTIVLNNIRFNLKVTAGTIGRGINFYH
ncbi:hypothetical protein [Nocardioides lianchengensis]|uniref:Uncharacterized protein n=1 Tax=Nocardioides lianchengensis TaxID=1045774 RepID=A0A1G7B5N3_9ACTN|nr:hypothetical protein [Nocardioides lianchengensis]NYG10107.1 hypothetical protein [Nocardioides lianchengensis]SDE22389.1 hypothetical protein SAMN05421872_11740 [Nocardioides lianchengensis]